MKRRGVLGGLLASPFAAKAAAQHVASGAMPSAGYEVGGMLDQAPRSMSRQAGIMSPSSIEAMERYHDALSPHKARWNRQRNLVDRAGGIPFHLSSMASNKPWFILQRTEVWRRQQDEEFATFRERLEQEILGVLKNP